MESSLNSFKGSVLPIRNTTSEERCYDVVLTPAIIYIYYFIIYMPAGYRYVNKTRTKTRTMENSI